MSWYYQPTIRKLYNKGHECTISKSTVGPYNFSIVVDASLTDDLILYDGSALAAACVQVTY